MKIKEIKIWHLNIPLRISFKHALAERKTSSSIVIKITLDTGHSGYGEALPREYVTGETIDSSIAAIKDLFSPVLKDISFSSYEHLQKTIISFHEDKKFSKNLTSLCAIELALIDALSKANNMNIYSFTQNKAKTNKILYSMVVSADNDSSIEKYTKIAKRLWIKDIKFKVKKSLEYNEDAIALIKNIYPYCNLRVDANCSWNTEEACKNYAMMKKFNVLSCEQPLKRDNIEGLTKLVKTFPEIYTCVDESLCSFEDAKMLIEKKAASLFNIRISKNGGLSNAMRIYQLAKANNIHCQLGAQVGETAILSAYGRIFAAQTGDLLFHEGSFGSYLLSEDIITKKYAFSCRGLGNTKLHSCGLPFKIIEDKINKFATQSYEA